MTVEAVDEISSDEEEIQDDLPEVVGTRVARRFTNWRHRYDALSQIEQHHQRQLENLLESNEQSMKGIFILMFFFSVMLHFVRRRVAQGHGDVDLGGRCTTALAMLLLVAVYHFEQQTNIQSALNSLLDIYVTDRILEDLPPPKNRAFADLSEEVAYGWTRFTKEQLIILFLHLRYEMTCFYSFSFVNFFLTTNH